MKSKIYVFIIFFLIFTFKINYLLSIEIRNLVQVNDIIITNEDLRKEKIILNYLFNNKINEESINKFALENLIEINIKRIEIKKYNILISDLETNKFLNIVLKNQNKTLDDFRLKTKNRFYEKYLKDKIQIEMSWNQLILKKFSNTLNINMDEILARTGNENTSSTKLGDFVINEKNKKLQSISETYFNEVKSKTLIKFL